MDWPPGTGGVTTTISRPDAPGLLWGHLKALVYQEKIVNIPHLKQRIIEDCSQITPDVFKKVQREWANRIDMCIVQDGGHVECVL
jgi:hypothetical protein